MRCWPRLARVSPPHLPRCMSAPTNGWLLLVYVTLQRLVELVIAQRNTRKLLAAGAYEAGAGHYPVMIALHATWLVTLWIFGWNRTLVPAYVVFFIVLQFGRY